MNQPEMLPGTEDSRTLSHPMWNPPPDDSTLDRHIHALRTQIAHDLTPFDGRPYSERVVDFCREVYLIGWDSGIHVTLGQIAWIRYRHLKSIDGTIEALGRHRTGIEKMVTQLKVQRNAIDRLADRFTEAICASLDQ